MYYLMDFIKNKDISVVFFTNMCFLDLNYKIKTLSIELDESNFLFIDSNTEIDIIERLNIKSVPLFHIYKNGRLIEELFGSYTNICNIIRLHF